MDLKVSFRERDMVTPIYVKMDAPDRSLLSEGVCRQLGIVWYDKSVVPRKTGAKDNEATGTWWCKGVSGTRSDTSPPGGMCPC